ncbi:MAG: mechanosensitive ion channel family protein [Anaerolineales bacterium]
MADFLARLQFLLNIQMIEVGNTSVTLATALTALLVILATFWISRVIRRGIRRMMRRRGMADEQAAETVLSLLHYFLLVIGFAIALQTIGIELGTMFAAGAVFAVGLGFAMQNIAQNFVAGVILLTERTIRIGDVLEVEGTIVKVRKSGIRATIVRSRDGEELIVPNSTLVQSTVKNFTLEDSSYRLQTRVGVSYESDLNVVRRTLVKILDEIEWKMSEPNAQVFLQEFGNSAVIFDVAMWMDNPWHARRRLSNLNEAIWWGLKEAGIVIAFQQMDVHFDPKIAQSLAQLGQSTQSIERDQG